MMPWTRRITKQNAPGKRGVLCKPTFSLTLKLRLFVNFRGIFNWIYDFSEFYQWPYCVNGGAFSGEANH